MQKKSRSVATVSPVMADTTQLDADGRSATEGATVGLSVELAVGEAVGEPV
jgi:hypothetical protein